MRMIGKGRGEGGVRERGIDYSSSVIVLEDEAKSYWFCSLAFQPEYGWDHALWVVIQK